MTKRVVSPDMVAHLWANQSQDEARTSGGNFYFRGPAIYSYRDGFPLAVFSAFADADGRRVVFRNGAGWTASKTTSRHNSAVGSAIRGHALRVITIHGAHEKYAHYQAALSPTECVQLAKGNAAALAPIVARMAAHARGLIADAMRRRSADRAANGLDGAARILENCDFIATLGRNARERSKLARAIGARPIIPAGGIVREIVNAGESYEWSREFAAPNFWEIVAPLRAATLADEARAEVKRYEKRAAESWKDARNAKLSARARFDSCNDAARESATVARICARGKIALPRGVPTVKTAKAYADTLRPRAALLWGADNAASVQRAAITLRRAFYSWRRMRRGPDSSDTSRRDRDARQVLIMADEPQVKSVRAALVVLAENGAMSESASYPPLFPVLVALAMQDGPNRKRAAAALRDMRAALHAFDTLAAPIALKLDRANARERLEESARRTSADILDAERVVLRGALPERGRTVGWLIQSATGAAASYAVRYAETPPDLRRGLPESFDVAALEAMHGRADFEQHKRNASQEFAHAVACLDDARALESRGFLYSAQIAIEKATAAAAAAIRADDCATRAGAAIGAAYEKTRAATLVTDADALHASLAARIAALSESEHVAMWRNGDDEARDGFRYRAAPRFRIRPRSGGSEIESTMGAVVSVTAGRLLWRRIRAAVRNGRAESFSYGTGPHIGPFTLSSIGTDGSAVVGCHNISAQEARDFAAFMSWPAIGDTDADDAAAA